MSVMSSPVDISSQQCIIINSSSPSTTASEKKRKPPATYGGAGTKRLRKTEDVCPYEISDDEYDGQNRTVERSIQNDVDLEVTFSDVSEPESDSLLLEGEGPTSKPLELTDDESVKESSSETKDFFDNDSGVKKMSLDLINAYRIKSTKTLPEFKRSRSLVKTDSHSTKAVYRKALNVRRQSMEKYKLPPVLFLEELQARASIHLSKCESILSGKMSSLYYTMAKQVAKNSKRQVITKEDLTDLNIMKFTAGYFGSRRQAIVGMLIMEKYGSELKKHKNPVVTFWGPFDFSQYVLAPEILSHLCMEDFNLKNIEDAWDILQATIDFGIKVADSDPLEIYEIELEEQELQNLNLGKEYSSMTYRKDPRQS